MKKLELFIIRDNELFLEEDSFNLKLLYNLYIRKFFQKNYNSLYEKKTISILEYISNRIINIKDISYNELICISKKNNRIELFSLLDGIDKSIYKKIIDFLEIAEIYNDFKTIQFSSLQKLLNFIENFKTINIEMEKKKTNLRYLHEIFKFLKEKMISNNLFQKIMEKTNFTKKVFDGLFEEIINIFDYERKIEENNFIHFFFLFNEREKNNIIKNLLECLYLYNIIYFSYEKVILHNIKYETIFNISESQIYKGKIKMLYMHEKNKITKVYELFLNIKLKIKNEKDKGKKNSEKAEINFNEFYSFLLFLDINPDSICNVEANELINIILNKKPIRIISIISEKIEALEFLLSITSQDCKNLRELAGEVHGGNNQNFLSIEDLNFFEKIVESFEIIKNQVNNEKEFISNLSIQLEEDELKKYLEKYPQYKEFFSENLDKNKFTSEVIQKILNNSQFLILNSNKNNFKAFYKNEGEELKLEKDSYKIYKDFDFNYMIYLRDRALERYKITDSFFPENKGQNNDFTKNLEKEEKRIFERNQIFSEYVRQINELLNLLKEISQKGYIYYFEDEEVNKNKENKENKDIISYFKNIENNNDISLLKIKIKIENNDEEGSYKALYFLNGEENKNFLDIYKIIENIHIKIINIQKNAYMTKNYINFIYGKQFHLFFDYFYKQKINENFNYFLYYFTSCENFNLKSVAKSNQHPILKMILI